MLSVCVFLSFFFFVILGFVFSLFWVRSPLLIKPVMMVALSAAARLGQLRSFLRTFAACIVCVFLAALWISLSLCGMSNLHEERFLSFYKLGMRIGKRLSLGLVLPPPPLGWVFISSSTCITIFSTTFWFCGHAPLASVAEWVPPQSP